MNHTTSVTRLSVNVCTRCNKLQRNSKSKHLCNHSPLTSPSTHLLFKRQCLTEGCVEVHTSVNMHTHCSRFDFKPEEQHTLCDPAQLRGKFTAVRLVCREPPRLHFGALVLWYIYLHSKHRAGRAE